MVRILEKIVFLRQNKGLRQEDMARSLRVSTSTYSKMETGQINIGLSRFAAITALLGIQHCVLLEEEDQVKAIEQEVEAAKNRLYRYNQMIIAEQRKLIRIYDQKNFICKI